MATTSSTLKRKKEGLGWIEWLRGWTYVIHEMLFQRIMASHLQNPHPLPTVNHLTCIITGSTSGIGSEIARQLAEAGAHVVMAVRNTNKAHELIHKWQNEWSGVGLPLNVEVMELDLLSLESVVRFAEAWNAHSGPLHVLINNAGIFSIGEPQKFSKDGYEEHMQVNHLAPALLSILLLPSLIRGSPSRIINVNSVMHYVGFVDTEDMNVVSGKRKYSSLIGYTSSKLAQVMFSSFLHRRLPTEVGIIVVCVSPGVVHTNVARDLPKVVQAAYHLIPYFIFSPQEGTVMVYFINHIVLTLLHKVELQNERIDTFLKRPRLFFFKIMFPHSFRLMLCQSPFLSITCLIQFFMIRYFMIHFFLSKLCSLLNFTYLTVLVLFEMFVLISVNWIQNH